MIEKERDFTDSAPVGEGALGFDDTTLQAIAEVYKNEGNDAFKREEFSDAIAFYSEGIKVNCRDDELNAKLYNNRSMANFYSGKTMFHNSLVQSRKPLHNGHLGTKGK